MHLTTPHILATEDVVKQNTLANSIYSNNRRTVLGWMYIKRHVKTQTHEYSQPPAVTRRDGRLSRFPVQCQTACSGVYLRF